MVLKIKGQYVSSLDVNKDETFNARVTFKEFKMLGRDKKTIKGLYVDSFKIV